jgi:hypothetical protein
MTVATPEDHSPNSLEPVPGASQPVTTLDEAARPRVLFVGADASSPQIAASLLHRWAGDRVAVSTAGTQTTDRGGRSDEMLVAMGLNPADEKRLSTGALHTADRVVILGDDLDVARLPGPSYEEWDLRHDDLMGRVQALSDELTATAVVTSRPAPLHRLKRLLGSIRCR